MGTSVGKFRGKIESVDGIKESKDKGTPFYSCICVITEEGEHKGRRVPWSGFLSENTATRTLKSMIAAGCTFPGDDYEDFTGLGSKEVMLDIEEELYTPERSEENPEPKEIKTWRVSWVNSLVRGMVGTDLDSGKRKTLGAGLKGALAAARSGGRHAAGESPDDGIPVDPKTGKKKF